MSESTERQRLASEMASIALRLRQLVEKGHRLSHDEWIAVYAMEQVAKTSSDVSASDVAHIKKMGRPMPCLNDDRGVQAV